MDHKKLSLVICTMALVLNALCTVGMAQTVKLDSKLNERVVMVPVGSGLFSVKLETTIFTPAGEGPFPILIMNHGKAPGIPSFQPRARYPVISREFVKRGYAVVIPMRKGFSQSTGIYVNGGCAIAGNARAQAEDVLAALEYTLQQPWADKNRILIAGQSHGGLTTMAFGSINFPGVKGLINFAGGLRVDNCQWKSPLVDAFADFGAKTKVPSIWFYGANDSYFNPELAARMRDAYNGAGGHAKLVAYGPFGNDSHSMSSSPDGLQIWWAETEQFLQDIGMPTEVKQHKHSRADDILER
jgi:dienelactone hydrolase